jgi:hypothetical protein
MLFVIFLLFVPGVLFYLGIEVNVIVRKVNLRPIITALKDYKRDRGYYPDSIEFLELSGHIESLPETKFRYNLLDPDKYTLCFGTDLTMFDFPANADCDFECYSSTSRRWEPGSDKGKFACY